MICEMSRHSGTDSLTQTENKLLVALQTNIRIIDTKMAAGTDHYLEVIKLLRLSVARQQLSNYFVNWQELFMRHNVNWG